MNAITDNQIERQNVSAAKSTLTESDIEAIQYMITAAIKANNINQKYQHPRYEEA